jgi:hypothetical protein
LNDRDQDTEMEIFSMQLAAAALIFAAQPETFPVFREFALQKVTGKEAAEKIRSAGMGGRLENFTRMLEDIDTRHLRGATHFLLEQMIIRTICESPDRAADLARLISGGAL